MTTDHYQNLLVARPRHISKMNVPDKPPYKINHVPSGLKNPRPNIVIFMPDQLRYDALGCSGNNVAKTPNIDKFAARGTRFTNWPPKSRKFDQAMGTKRVPEPERERVSCRLPCSSR